MELRDWLAKGVELTAMQDSFKDLVDERMQWVEDRISAGLASEGEARTVGAAILALVDQWEMSYREWIAAAPESVSVDDVLSIV